MKPRRGFTGNASGAYQNLEPKKLVSRSVTVEDGDPLESVKAGKDSDDQDLRQYNDHPLEDPSL